MKYLNFGFKDALLKTLDTGTYGLRKLQGIRSSTCLPAGRQAQE